jgi:uncharacterized membrane protein
MNQNPISFIKLCKLSAVFLAVSIACTFMLVMRRPIYGHTTMHYLVWNLFLAWIPFGLAVVAWLLTQFDLRQRWPLVLCAGAWLVFFPNAPYIITDIIHIRKMPAGPIWYDLILTVAFAWTGFLLGFASLYVMHLLVSCRWGWRKGWLFVAGVTGLSGLGIYLGRFLRLNSWQVLSPLDLLNEISFWFSTPHNRSGSVVFIALVGMLLFLVYLMMYALTHVNLHPVPETIRRDEAPPIDL